MSHSLLKKSLELSLVFCLIFSLFVTQPVNGNYSGIVAASGQANVTFANMGMNSPKSLPGPLSDYSLQFNLPLGWSPSGMVTLDLQLTGFFSSLVPSENSSTISGLTGGELSLYMNGTLVDVKTLQQSGEQAVQFTFDSNLLSLPSKTSSNVLLVRWDGSASCQMNLLSSITVLPSSSIGFSYLDNPGKLSLNDFPVPFIIGNSIEPTGLQIVVPANPTQSELQAALIVAAGIGQLSDGLTGFTMESLESFNPSKTGIQNLILVINSEKLSDPKITALGLSANSQIAPGEGIVQLFRNANGYGLLISGDAEGVIKAAQMTGANQLFAAGNATRMIVGAVNSPVGMIDQEDMSLQDLGVGELLFSQSSGLVQSFDFYLPDGEQARADSSFELILSHSQQLDYLRSGLQVKLNGYPAVSLRLTDSTSNEASFRLILPSNLIHPGRNTLEFTAALSTRDLCMPPLESIAWLRISSSSLLHVPRESAVANPIVPRTFKDFPDSFLSGTQLDNVTFVLSPSVFESVSAAGLMAFELGSSLKKEGVIRLNAFWSDAVDPLIDQTTNLILVGKPLDFKSLGSENQFPALVFTPENTLSSQSALEIVPDLAAVTNTGYVAIRGFDTRSNRLLLAVLGNNPMGIQLAANAISTLEATEHNLAIVVNEGVQTSWLDQSIATGKISSPDIQPTVVPDGTSSPQQFRQKMLIWALPLIVILMFLLVVLVLYETRRKNRKQ
jgi:hypothetical protein